MNAVTARDRATLFAIALSPVLAFVALRLFGYIKLARLGGLALLAVAAATVVFLRPRWGLYALVFYIYSGVGLFMPVNLAAPLISIVLVSVLLEWTRGEEPRLPGAFFWIAVGLFILAALNSTLVARDMAACLRELGAFFKVLLVVVLAVHLIRTPDQLRALFYVVFAGAVGTAVLGALAIRFGWQGAGENFLYGVHVMRFTGAHVDPNKAAAYMCSAIPLGIFAVRYCHNRFARLAFLLGVIVLVVGTFATFSRSTFVSIAVVLLGVAAYEVRSRRTFIVLATVLALGVVLAPRHYWDRVLELPGAFQDTTQDWSVYTRMLALRTGWELFLDHPFTGVGLGNFLTASASQLFVRIVVHNTYVEILAATGIFGLCWFVAMLASGLRHAVTGARRRWGKHPAWMRSLSYYTALSAVSICLSAFFATMSFRYPLWIPVAAGLVIGNLLRADERA